MYHRFFLDLLSTNLTTMHTIVVVVLNISYGTLSLALRCQATSRISGCSAVRYIFKGEVSLVLLPPEAAESKPEGPEQDPAKLARHHDNSDSWLAALSIWHYCTSLSFQDVSTLLLSFYLMVSMNSHSSLSCSLVGRTPIALYIRRASRLKGSIVIVIVA